MVIPLIIFLLPVNIVNAEILSFEQLGVTEKDSHWSLIVVQNLTVSDGQNTIIIILSVISFGEGVEGFFDPFLQWKIEGNGEDSTLGVSAFPIVEAEGVTSTNATSWITLSDYPTEYSIEGRAQFNEDRL